MDDWRPKQSNNKMYCNIKLVFVRPSPQPSDMQLVTKSVSQDVVSQTASLSVGRSASQPSVSQ